MKSKSNIIVIGGGVLGTSVAYNPAKAEVGYGLVADLAAIAITVGWLIVALSRKLKTRTGFDRQGAKTQPQPDE